MPSMSATVPLLDRTLFEETRRDATNSVRFKSLRGRGGGRESIERERESERASERVREKEREKEREGGAVARGGRGRERERAQIRHRCTRVRPREKASISSI